MILTLIRLILIQVTVKPLLVRKPFLNLVMTFLRRKFRERLVKLVTQPFLLLLLMHVPVVVLFKLIVLIVSVRLLLVVILRVLFRVKGQFLLTNHLFRKIHFSVLFSSLSVTLKLRVILLFVPVLFQLLLRRRLLSRRRRPIIVLPILLWLRWFRFLLLVVYRRARRPLKNFLVLPFRLVLRRRRVLLLKMLLRQQIMSRRLRSGVRFVVTLPLKLEPFALVLPRRFSLLLRLGRRLPFQNRGSVVKFGA